MLQSIEKLNTFRRSLYSLFPKRSDTTFNLLDALSSSGHECKSVVELSESAAFRRQYSSITDAIADGLPSASFEAIERLVFNTLCPKEPAIVKFFLDCTGAPRPWAKKLRDKTIVYAPNPAPGNKPIAVGHQYSLLCLSPQEQVACEKHWILPLCTKRVKSDEKGNESGMRQLINHTTKNLTDTTLAISAGDTLYGTKNCRRIAAENQNLVHIFRLSSKRTLYRKVSGEVAKTHKAGRKRVFGEKVILNDHETLPSPDGQITLEYTTKKQVAWHIELTQWNDLLTRGSRDFRAENHPITLVRVTVRHADGTMVFRRPLWIAITGKRRHEVSMETAYATYRQRYDIEHFFRFGKQKLLLNAFQTPDTEHEEAWWKFVPLAYIQLYLASNLAEALPKPWERYLDEYRNPDNNKPGFQTPTQTQRAFGALLKQLDNPARPCVPRGKTQGRRAGESLGKRETSEIIFRTKKNTNCANDTLNGDSQTHQEAPQPEIIDRLLREVLKKLALHDIEPKKFAEKLLC